MLISLYLVLFEYTKTIKKTTCYPVKTENRIFVKANGFLSFIKNMSKNIGKNISKNVSTIYSQKRFDHARRSGTDTLKILPNE